MSRGEKRMKKSNHIFLKILFALYIVGLLSILFFARVNRGDLYQWKLFSEEHLERIHLIPFATIRRFLARLNEQTIQPDFVIRNVAINLLMFLPMGAALPILFPKRFDRFWKTILFIALLVIFLEILQFITFYGSADIDDLLFNTFGAAVGYGIYHIITKIKSSSHS